MKPRSVTAAGADAAAGAAAGEAAGEGCGTRHPNAPPTSTARRGACAAAAAEQESNTARRMAEERVAGPMCRCMFCAVGQLWAPPGAAAPHLSGAPS
mmetsp:Transcript_32561/g.107477  ORF Transcript_32561/g.107477 Transcript_32561/m.107477 type:complete len:97 (+) Transcript_32561:796-1086(+)